jgi:hypothetical protein
MDDPVCINLALKTNFSRTVYVLDNNMGRLVATCIPSTVQVKERGWCATQGPAQAQPTDPGYSSGWGFCGSEEDQLECDKIVDKKLTNTSKIQVSQFDEAYCTETLQRNLNMEPGALKDPKRAFLRNVFCAGKNLSAEWENIDIYRFDDTRNIFIKQLMDRRVTETLTRAKISPYGLDGVACAGDAGAPLFKYVEENGVRKPVLVGLFSFLLWGTCRGKEEPSYFTNVEAYMDSFILKYIPKNETCIVNI